VFPNPCFSFIKLNRNFMKLKLGFIKLKFGFKNRTARFWECIDCRKDMSPLFFPYVEELEIERYGKTVHLFIICERY